MREHLDLAGHEVRVDRAFRARRARCPVTRDAELVAQRLRGGEGRGAIGIADDLHEAFAVAQVDEDDAAVVAAAMDPAGQRDGLVEIAAVDAAAVVGAFKRVSERSWCSRVVAGKASRRRARRQLARHPGAGVATRRVGARCRQAARAAARAPRGATTPIEMTYFSASSTVMSSSRTCDLRHDDEVAAASGSASSARTR